ncbi:MAG: NAD(P)-dependent oxidoreductase [Pelagibacteraceae bacterium]|nr:NAD(P)-dependent oxidoreductase [Pelagibacteraceae bacterium]
MKLKSLLIIGGTGFFGKSILKYLSINKSLNININKIFILSRKKLKIGIYNHKLKKKFKVIKINSNLLKIKKLPIVDYVIYAAILQNYKNDYQAVKKYLDLAKEYHAKSKILYVSSGAVYGKQSNKNLGFQENYLTFKKKINFKNGYKREYSVIKRKNEKLFERFAKKFGKVSIARCFSFVGEHLPIKSPYAAGNIIGNILNNENINIKANYEVVRSYMHEEDLVSSLFKILDYSNQDCPIYNVGSDDAISIHKLADLLAKKYNLCVDINNKKNSKKLDKYIPSINKLRKDFNFYKKLSSSNAVIKTIHQLKNKKY